MVRRVFISGELSYERYFLVLFLRVYFRIVDEFFRNMFSWRNTCISYRFKGSNSSYKFCFCKRECDSVERYTWKYRKYNCFYMVDVRLSSNCFQLEIQRDKNGKILDLFKIKK